MRIGDTVHMSLGGNVPFKIIRLLRRQPFLCKEQDMNSSGVVISTNRNLCLLALAQTLFVTHKLKDKLVFNLFVIHPHWLGIIYGKSCLSVYIVWCETDFDSASATCQGHQVSRNYGWQGTFEIWSKQSRLGKPWLEVAFTTRRERSWLASATSLGRR